VLSSAASTFALDTTRAVSAGIDEIVTTLIEALMCQGSCRVRVQAASEAVLFAARPTFWLRVTVSGRDQGRVCELVRRASRGKARDALAPSQAFEARSFLESLKSAGTTYCLEQVRSEPEPAY